MRVTERYGRMKVHVTSRGVPAGRLHHFCEAIISRFYTWHRSDGGGTGPSAEAGFRGRVDEIGIVVGGIPK